MVETIGRVRYCLLMLIKLKSLLIGQKLKTKNIKLIFIVLNAQSLQKIAIGGKNNISSHFIDCGYKKSYCLKRRKNTESKNLKVVNINKGKPRLLSKCAVCGSKKIEIHQRTRS